MGRRRQPFEELRRWFAFVLSLGLIVTLSEITEQHYYRARFSHIEMYIPVLATPLAILASLIRAVSSDRAARLLFGLANSTVAAVGLLGLFYHWTGNFRKYRQKEQKGELPGSGKTEEDRKHGRPGPDVAVGDYNLGQLLEVGSRGRPWLAPLSLTGLGALGLLVEEFGERHDGDV